MSRFSGREGTPTPSGAPPLPTLCRSWGVSLCGVSGGGGWLCCWLGVVEGCVWDHGVQGQDAAVGQGEDGLAWAFALVSFALVVGAADRV